MNKGYHQHKGGVICSTCGGPYVNRATASFVAPRSHEMKISGIVKLTNKITSVFCNPSSVINVNALQISPPGFSHRALDSAAYQGALAGRRGRGS